MEIENDIFEALENYGHEVIEIYTEEYKSKGGETNRAVYARILGEIPEEIFEVAGYEIH